MNATRAADTANDTEAAQRFYTRAQAVKPAEDGSEYARGLLRSGSSGMTLGFNDEITATLVAAGQKAVDIWNGTEDPATFGEVYSSVVEAERAGQEQFAEENPKTAFASEVVGGVLTGGVGTARALAAATATKVGSRVLGGATSKVGRRAFLQVSCVFDPVRYAQPVPHRFVHVPCPLQKTGKTLF